MDNLCENEKDPLTFGLHFGGYCTQLQQPADHFIKLPKNIDPKKSAPLFCAGCTMFDPILRYGKTGMKTAVIGVGGLGHLGIIFLKKMGYNVTAITSSHKKDELIKKLGADHILISSDLKQMEENKSKFDMILNTIPIHENYERYIKLTAKLGYFIQIGAATEDPKIPLLHIIENEVKVVGINGGRLEACQKVAEFAAKNNAYPICEEFSFEDFPKAYGRMSKENPKFRVVVNVQDYFKKK